MDNATYVHDGPEDSSIRKVVGDDDLLDLKRAGVVDIVSQYSSCPTKSVPLTMEDMESDPLLYGVNDVPPWYMCLFLGFQHYLEMIGATVACPFILTPALCMEDDDPNKANIISTLVFMSGIITILQSTVGTRLPIVQGGSFSYLVPSLAIMNLPQWKCPPPDVIAGMTTENKTELWQVRMREIQGAIIFAALFEAIFAITGLIGFLTKFITPLTVAPAISLIGLSLFKNVTEQISKNAIVAFSMIVLLILFSQHMKHIQIWTPFAKRGKDGRKERFPLFQVFPVLLSLCIVWGVCAILTVTNILSEGDAARADSKLKICKAHPGSGYRIHSNSIIPILLCQISVCDNSLAIAVQWGWPTVSIGAVIGIFCGVMTSIIESIGDYYACASIAKTTVPPTHAINRGIFCEGLGCILSGFWGSGNGSTSYSNNIGTITVTKVASRRVIQVSGIIMVVLSLVGKAGAIFIGIPDPILGGLFLFIFPLIMAVGIGTLSEVCLESGRNVFIVSFAIFTGLAVSQWAQSNPGVIQTGSPEWDSVIQILLSTGMFVAGFTGFLLDNTIAGTDSERGFTKRHEAERAAEIYRDETYDLPFGMGMIKKLKFLKFLPISPTYEYHSMTSLPAANKKSETKSDETASSL